MCKECDEYIIHMLMLFNFCREGMEGFGNMYRIKGDQRDQGW
jgi:hypothetical protein